MENKVELLAPVGCEENFYAAINNGANAIYLGLSDFSARKNAGNFTLERLPYFVAYAHLFNVKVYLAINTVIKNAELEKYFKTVSNALSIGVDAFIVQDLFLGRALKQAFPSIVLHLSTQAGINNTDGAKQALSYGFKRVILARETGIEEIKKIAKIIETEVFVHGAMCTCFSGHCYFSSFIGGKSGNRGACRQPCRKLYKYVGSGIIDELRYALSLSDLALPKRIEELIMAGVKSFKIEGRMRSFEYVSTACDFYSELILGDYNKLKFDSLKRCYNRGNYTEGLTFGKQKNLICDKIQNHSGVCVATVSAVNGNRLTLSSVKHKITEGDCFKVILSGKEIGSAMAVLEGGKVVVKYNRKAVVGSELAITKDVTLSKMLYNKTKKHDVKSHLIAKIGEPIKLSVNGRDFYSEYIVTPAVTSAVTKSEIKENLRKVDVYPFNVIASCEIDQNIFIPKKVLNSLRAAAYKQYFYSFSGEILNVESKLNVVTHLQNCTYDSLAESEKFTIISHNFDFKLPEAVKNVVFCPNNYNDIEEKQTFFKQVQKTSVLKYLYVPAFLNGADEEIIGKYIDGFDGIYCESASGLFLAKRFKVRYFAGVEVNVTNDCSFLQLQSDGASEISISKELSDSESICASGWRLAFGDIKIMSLIYCPFGKTCGGCKRTNSFILKDEEGRCFPVRRYKLSDCRFEIYNNSLLRSKKSFENSIFDFTMRSTDEIKKLLDLYFNGKQCDLKIGFTIGNFAKGVE